MKMQRHTQSGYMDAYLAKRSGSSPREAAWQGRHTYGEIICALIIDGWQTLTRGIFRIRMQLPTVLPVSRQLRNIQPMHMDYLIWRATYGNGFRTGIGQIITQRLDTRSHAILSAPRRRLIQRSPTPKNGYSVADRSSVRRHTAPGTWWGRAAKVRSKAQAITLGSVACAMHTLSRDL